MIVELSSDDEFFTLLEMLKTEGRQVFTLWHPRKSDRWLWRVDVESPRGVGQTELDLGAVRGKMGS